MAPSIVVEFRPLTDQEVFTVANGLSRDHTTGCTMCGAQWSETKRVDPLVHNGWHLDHRDDCRYVRTLDLLIERH